MANTTLFQSTRGSLLPDTTTRNDAGGVAYELSSRATLARLAATGCLSETYYASAVVQLDRVLETVSNIDTDFIAQTALYARRRAYMKDMPALLCAVLATRDLERLAEIFPQVIDNGRMLRNFVQIMRSGATGRRSLGSAPKRLVREWLESATEDRLIRASVGNDPSLADIVKMVHPRPNSAWREAFYGWLIGKPYDVDALPTTLREFEAWKKDRSGALPNVPFQMLTALPLGKEEWTRIAETAGWTMTRMNLNTFARHGVFETEIHSMAHALKAMGASKEETILRKIVSRLSDPDQVRRARAFPYQLMVAFQNAADNVPSVISNALQDAMEIALENVPAIAGNIVICPDVSGSMGQSITGWRSNGASSKVKCVDVAALVAAAFLRTNQSASVLPFECDVVKLRLNARDSVMTNATRLSKCWGGGTNCSAPLAHLNRQKATPDLVIFVSDNESWIDTRFGGRQTAMLCEWEKIRQRNPRARLVCLDIVPNCSSQAPDREDILNIGGFSDAVFDIIASFAAGENGTDHWIREIKKQPLMKR